MLETIRCAARQAEVVDLSERLEDLWDLLATDPATAEYLALRRGRPLDWDSLRTLPSSGEMHA